MMVVLECDQQGPQMTSPVFISMKLTGISSSVNWSYRLSPVEAQQC